MVSTAPLFEDIAAEVYRKLKDVVFVAHNVNFDYRFIKASFERCGIRFSATHLCTLQLSRKLYHNIPSYSLGKLCKSLGIEVKNRHRAYGDAEATAVLFNKMFEMNEAFVLNSIQQEILDTLKLPMHIDVEQIESVRENTGVYMLFGADDTPLYISRTKNLRKSIIAHFLQIQEDSFILKLQEYICSFQVFETPSEMVAIIEEAKLIKKYNPKFGTHAADFREFKFGLNFKKDKKGYLECLVEELTESEHEIALKFSSRTKATRYINKLHYKLQLSPKNKEVLPAEEYNQALKNLMKPAIYPFREGLILEKREAKKQSIVYIIQNYNLVGYTQIDKNASPCLEDCIVQSCMVVETTEIRKSLLLMIYKKRRNIEVLPAYSESKLSTL